MAAEAAGLRPATRLLLLVLAVTCGLLSAAASSSDALPAPAWLTAWSAAHPDPHPLSPDESQALARGLDGQRHEDVVLLLAGLAVGCLAVAAQPPLARAAGGVLAGVLAAGSVALGIEALGASLRGQWDAARDGQWSLGDDSLPALAGPYCDALRELRLQIGPGDAVLLVGTNQPLFNAAAWALSPRAIFPVLQDVPDSLGEEDVRALARSLRLGADFPRRWLLDLRALELGQAAAHPALIEVTP
jgi:hypothetical protein